MDESQNIHVLMKDIQQHFDNLVGTEVVSEANLAVQKHCPSRKKFALIADFLVCSTRNSCVMRGNIWALAHWLLSLWYCL